MISGMDGVFEEDADRVFAGRDDLTTLYRRDNAIASCECITLAIILKTRKNLHPPTAIYA